MEDLSDVQIQTVGAIGDMTKIVIGIALLNSAGFGAMAIHFYADHLTFFLTFAVLSIAGVLLAFVAWLVLPASAAEIVAPLPGGPLHDDERTGQRTSGSWRPRD